jgi:hypothetical protein
MASALNPRCARCVAAICGAILRASKSMKRESQSTCDSFVARSLASEDLRCGDFVAILHEIVEWPSFFWSCDSHVLPPDEPVRMVARSSEGGTPLKVKAICLPFVFVKKPCGQHRTLDVRQHRLVRLTAEYAQPVWKTLSKGRIPRRAV